MNMKLGNEHARVGVRANFFDGATVTTAKGDSQKDTSADNRTVGAPATTLSDAGMRGTL